MSGVTTSFSTPCLLAIPSTAPLTRDSLHLPPTVNSLRLEWCSTDDAMRLTSEAVSDWKGRQYNFMRCSILQTLQLLIYSTCSSNSVTHSFSQQSDLNYLECPQVVQPLHYCQTTLKGQGDFCQLQRGQPLTGHKGIHQRGRGKGTWKVV